MTDKTTKVLDTYVKMLLKEQEIIAEFEAVMEKIDSDKKQIEAFLTKNVKDLKTIPLEIEKYSPFMAWKITPKTDKSVIDAHMMIDDVLIPNVERKAKGKVNLLKEQRTELENWALNELTKRKASNFSVKNSGRAETRLSVKYSINNKKEFVKWAVDDGVEDELTITLRPNSKFIADVVETTGELPPAVSSFRETKVVFVKG